MSKIIIADTCVILDILLANRERHKEAQQLANYINKNNKKIVAPMTSLYETLCSLKQIGLEETVKLDLLENQFKYDAYPIDKAA